MRCGGLLLLLVGCTATPMTLPAMDAGSPAGSRDATVAADAAPAAGACAASDRDGDGYGTDPSCPERDCDDANLAVHPGAVEACNGKDDDCDGRVDEDLGEGACGDGACRRVVPYCVAGRPAACTPAGGTPETCNGADDDCDGRVDNGVTGAACGMGACRRTSECRDGAFTPCVPGDPMPERCNRQDDDCDGVVDNGFRAESVNSTYTEMRARHEVCDGAQERMGQNCNAAFHRFCAGRGCATSGFGPLENSGDVALAGCVAAEPSREVSFVDLARAHEGCDGSRQRIGPDCNAAIHRWCAGQGFATGFGPVESGPSSVSVTCLRGGPAMVIQTTYTVLSTHHDACTQGTRYGPACNAAINRFCASQGFVTGFGPVENSGDTAVVACVAR